MMGRGLLSTIVPMPDGHVVEVSTIRLHAHQGGRIEVGLCLFSDEAAMIRHCDPRMCRRISQHTDEASALTQHAEVVDTLRAGRWPA